MSDPLKELGSGSGGDAVNPRVLYWQKELENALQREKEYRKNADRVVKIYEGDTKAENSFNVLFANTETLLPACYNQLPRPFVDRRFKDADPLGKHAATVLERTLGSLMDAASAEYTPFSNLMEQATLGALVPGRGVTWYKYDATFSKVDRSPAELPEDADLSAETAKTEVTGKDLIPAVSEKVEYETVCGEDVDYDGFCFGPGKRWANIPWVARHHDMTEADATASFGEELAAKLRYSAPKKTGADGWKTKSDSENNPQGTQNVALVWEIWNKEKKEVIFYAPSYTADLLKVVDDPYGLSGFFPCPEPLQFLLKRSKLIPTPLYMLYEEQAKELNRITTRINRILNALKVRGFYDGTMEGMKNLLEADDNTLLPAKNVAALQQGQSLQNSIWFMPFDVLVSALQALWQGREEVKSTIYEITGMADIMRGEGAASAPATLQNIKNQWGTLRLKRWQRYVQEYVRASLRIMGELAGKHFSVETFAQMTDLDYALPQEIEQAQKTIAAVNQAMMQMQQAAAMQQQSMAPPPGAPGPISPVGADPSGFPGMPPGGPPPQAPEPPPPPQPSPQMQQAMQEAQAVLAKPAWEDVIKLLRSDLQRNYRIDIETNSTIADTTAEDKDDVTSAMGAIAQMLQGFIPMVEQGALTMPVLKSMLLSVCRRFNFGREVEDSINQMPDQLPPPPQPAGPSPAEQQATEAKAQTDQQAAMLRMQTEQMNFQQEQQQHAFRMSAMQREEEMEQKAHQLDLMKMDMEMSKLAVEKELLSTRMQVEATGHAAKLGGLHRQEIVDRVQSQSDVRQAHAAAAKSELMTQTAQQQARAARNKPKGGKNAGV